MILYEIIELKEENLFTEKFDITILDKNLTNIYTIGLQSISNIESIENFPIKNKRKAIKQILDFLKYMDDKSKSLKGTDLINIHTNILIEKFSIHTYVAYMELLNELNIVRAVPYDIINEKTGKQQYYKFEANGKGLTKRYKLTDSYKKEDLCLVIFNDKKEIEYDINGRFNTKYVKTIKNIEIDLKAAIRDEYKNKTSNNSLRIRLNTLFNLYNKRFIKKGDNVDRIYHSLSNVSKISRKHLHIKEQKFNDIDIISCQPLLLCYLLRSLNMELDSNYLLDCESGNLYENFIIEGEQYIDVIYDFKDGKIISKRNQVIKIGYNLTKEEYSEIRQEIKRLLYKNIFFDFKSKSDISLKFKELYPITFESLEELDKSEEKMAYRLQNLEASIFNDLVPTKSKYYFTLFDAIYFTDLDDTGQLLIELTNKFQKMDILPKFKINE